MGLNHRITIFLAGCLVTSIATIGVFNLTSETKYKLCYETSMLSVYVKEEDECYVLGDTYFVREGTELFAKTKIIPVPKRFYDCMNSYEETYCFMLDFDDSGNCDLKDYVQLQLTVKP